MTPADQLADALDRRRIRRPPALSDSVGAGSGAYRHHATTTERDTP